MGLKNPELIEKNDFFEIKLFRPEVVAPRHKNEVSDDLNEVFKVGSANYNKEEALERMNLFIIKWGN
ncbi:MAG: hypothetical protein WC155_03580, partial [Candidatus Cloacimonadales bacterium]